MALSPRLNALIPSCRRLASHGWSTAAIARACSITRAEVRSILAVPVRPPRQPRVPRPPIDPERLVPRQRHRRRRVEGLLNRPRSPAEQARLSGWDRLATDDPLGLPPAIAAAAVPERLHQVEVLIPPATAEASGDWGSIRASARPGGANGNAALSDADAVRIRRRRAEGVSRKDLAAEFNVSVATITRITRGDTYRTAAAVEVLDLVGVIPAPPAVPEPQGERWDEPPGDRRRRGDD